MNKKNAGKFCMILGLTLILSAIGLILYNENEDRQAAKASESILPMLFDAADSSEKSDTTYTVHATDFFVEAPADSDIDNSSSDSHFFEESDSYVEFGSNSGYALEDLNVTVAKIDGYEYIGYVSIPSLDIELPVMSEWSYNRLKIAPCRYSGLHYTDNLVIAAHNYKRHFGKISKLNVGDTVIFTDLTGISFFYSVVLTETLQPDEVEEMISGDWDLTLFTCTYGGATRITVRCNRT